MVSFQRLRAVCRGLWGSDPRLSACSIDANYGAMEFIFFGVVLSHKLLHFWVRKAAKAVKTTMRRLAVFQRLRAVCRDLRGPDPFVCAYSIDAYSFAMEYIVLEKSFHINYFMFGSGKRPKLLKPPCADLLYFNGSGPSTGV